MSTTTTYTGVRIVDMPDLGPVTDDSSVVGERAGSGRFAATAFRDYVETAMQPEIDTALNTANAALHNTGRNLLHNPLFNVAQRGFGVWSTPGYTVDRWGFIYNLDTILVSRPNIDDAGRAQIGDEAAEFTLGNTFTGSPGGFNACYQHIEDVRRLAGKTVTVSFWAEASSALTFSVALSQHMGSGGAPSPDVNLASQAVTLSLNWTRHSLVFTLPSIAGKMVGTNRDDSTILYFYYSASGSQSGTINLWGMQLEVGSVATALEKPDPRYDLANCQRFYYVGTIVGGGSMTAGHSLYVPGSLPVQMRASPTLTITSSSGGTGLNSIALHTSNNRDFYGTGNATATAGALLLVNYTASADL